MASSLRSETNISDSSIHDRQQKRRCGLHSEYTRGTRTLALAATAALLCLSCPDATAASSRHIPEGRHNGPGGHRSNNNNNRFRFLSPRNDDGNDRPRVPTTPASMVGASSSSMSSSSRLRFSGSNGGEGEEEIPDSSSFNSTLTSTSAYGPVETDEKTSVTTTSFFRFPTETLKQEEQQPREPASPAFVSSPPRHILTAVQIQARFVISLMGVAGFIEGVCIRQHGCFPNLMTGTLLKVAEAIGSWNLSLACIHASMVTCYIGGAWLFSRWKHTAAPSTDDDDKKLKSSLRAVSALSGVFLLLSDVAARLSVLQQARLPLLAAAFGIINAGTLAAGAGVTFAMTGHVSKVGQGLATGSLLKPRDADSKPAADRISAQGLGAFFVAALLANLACGVMERTAATPLSFLGATIPLGTTVAVTHAAVFRWYVRATARASAAEAGTPR